jgi:hypothetical protein
MPDPDRAEPLNPDLSALEASLRTLAPTPAAVDRDRLMYAAGRASAPRAWAWPLAAVTSTLAACVLGVLLLLRPESRPAERIVYVPVPAPSPEQPTVEPASTPEEAAPSWLAPSRSRRLEEQILRWDLDALPPTPTPGGRPTGESYHMLLRSF